MRILSRAVFALAAATAALGSGGLVVAPHREPAGMPPMHQHAVSALRLPVLLLADAPGIPPAEELAAHARAHTLRPRWSAADGTPLPSLEEAHPLATLAGGVIFALLGFAVPRLPRPTRRPLAELPPAAIGAPQWRAPAAFPPPRLRVFAAL